MAFVLLYREDRVRRQIRNVSTSVPNYEATFFFKKIAVFLCYSCFLEGSQRDDTQIDRQNFETSTQMVQIRNAESLKLCSVLGLNLRRALCGEQATT